MSYITQTNLPEIVPILQNSEKIEIVIASLTEEVELLKKLLEDLKNTTNNDQV